MERHKLPLSRTSLRPPKDDGGVACMPLPVPGAAETATKVTPETVSVFVLRNLEL